tara:strand:+ start:61 stop:306 length:246 start_codon:yes stop_codon:yes gene_type:complete
MIISEEKDYFIYGCLSTLFVEGILCMFYGYCCENRSCDKLIKSRFYPSENVVLQRTHLITENDTEFENLGKTSPTDSFIDL